MSDKYTGKQVLGLALMGLGGGLTGKDVLGNYMQQQEEEKKLKAEQAYRDWQMKQGQSENDIKMAQANLVPDPNGEYSIGGQRYSRRPPVMPDLSKLNFGGNGLGITGATIDPMSGDTKINIGQTPENKQAIEDKARQTKDLESATQEWKSGKDFLNRIKNIWLETKPPNTGMLGIKGAGVLPQPLYGLQQSLGARFQWTENQKKDRLYGSYVGALKSRLAKGGIIGKDVGNLSVQEQQWVMDAVPSYYDYKDVGAKKIENMTGMLDAMYQARKSGYKNLDEMLVDKGQSYFKGQIITKGKKSYRVTGGDLAQDPDIEEIK